ncbi:hypothetical protein G6011_09073 [Alternaria panax]|uniref:Uncharacterized protein n=1 Tax=Alternaria panax TaxID=48097 RepID=A0AAD4IAC5_9PLEO|nr:hypothetical protein G6011_09073 [Alternaria panax]
MAANPSSPGPNATTATPIKQARSRKAGTTSQTEQGRAGSAGGVVLPKEPSAKVPAASTKKAIATPSTDDVNAAALKTQKKKPRKLNKEPTSTSTDTAKSTATNKNQADVPSPSELEALKSRVRGLEAKVEELYKAGAISDSRPGHSPRRRGKGRKTSSAAQIPTLSTTAAQDSNARVQELDDDEEDEADEELVRLEGELEVARQDLEHFHPRTRGATSGRTEYVEEIDRGASSGAGPDRQVTLSGSYRIPIPANVNLEDVKTIKSGVSAAQNVARSFLEQRRAAATLRAENNASSSQQQSGTKTTKVPASKSSSATTPKPKRSMSSTMEVAVDNSDGKQSWSEWIGGYSMAITRAVSKIEHEAAVEAQRSGNGGGGTSRPAAGGRRTSAPTSKKVAGKRPAAKTTLSGEQVHGLMS